MTYFQQNRKAHEHRYFLDANSGESICLCGKVKGQKDSSGSKYHNIPTEYNGIIYHSAFERDYAAELDNRKRMSLIKDWDRQVKLELKANGKRVCNYYIDFIVHFEDGHRQFTEVKGQETEAWRIKWKLLEATFDIDFKEHPDDELLLVKQIKDWRKSYAHLRASHNAKRQV